MELFANELSLHGQFRSPQEIHAAIVGFMKMRGVAQRFRRELYCRRDVAWTRPVSSDETLQQALGHLTNAEKSVVMSWLMKGGPFWDDLRQHGPDDYFRCDEEVVTDSSVGEAAFRVLHGAAAGLVSATPSRWSHSPVEVVWERDDTEPNRTAFVENWSDIESLERALAAAAIPPRSWTDTRDQAALRFERLMIPDAAFRPVQGVPFSSSSAERVMFLLEVLNRLAGEVESTGGWTTSGNRIYEAHFVGHTAVFSDSSTKEKVAFNDDLHFPHPERRGEKVFCPWHGKERYLQLRLHFSWPIQHSEPVSVVYLGPKITKK